MFVRIALLSIAALAVQVQAAELPDLQPLFTNHRYADIERLARARLTEAAGDLQAHLALGRLIVETDDLARFKEAEEHLSLCIERQPALAACHLWLARVYGKQIDGLFSAMRLAPKARAGFERAVELEPTNMDAVAGLVEFYVAAPPAVGGGKDKAAAVVARTTQNDPEAGRMLGVFLVLGDEKWAEAERVLAAPATTPPQESLRTVQAYLHLRLAAAWLQAKRPADALRVLQSGTQRFPADPALWLGCGRVLLELRRNEEAIAALERSIALHPTAAAYFRLGTAWAEQNEPKKAAAALERSISFVPAMPSAMREDAELRLKSIRAGQ